MAMKGAATAAAPASLPNFFMKARRLSIFSFDMICLLEKRIFRENKYF